MSTAGDDANPGSASLPFETLKKGLDSVNPGDTVYVNPGTYGSGAASVFRTVTHGTEVAPITIQGIGSPELTNKLFVTHAHYSIRGFTITSAPGIELETPECHDVLIESNLFHTAHYFIYIDAVRPERVEGPHDLTIRNNVFRDSDLHMITLMGHNNRIESNLFEKSNGWDALRVFGNDHVIAGNTFRDISEAEGNSNHTDIFQTFAANGEECHRIVIEQNLIENCLGQLMMLENGTGPNGIDFSQCTDWTFRNNLVLNSRAQCNVYIRNCHFLNNTFYHSARQEYGIISVPLNFKSGTSKGIATGGRCLNNIFIECGSGSGATGHYSVVPEITDFIADYNITSGPNGEALDADEANGVNGGVLATDLFVDLDARDFRVKSGSPANLTGANLSSTYHFNDDYTGTPRGTTWDIGAQTEGVILPPPSSPPSPPTNLRIITDLE